jgi:hypothetical protein
MTPLESSPTCALCQRSVTAQSHGSEVTSLTGRHELSLTSRGVRCQVRCEILEAAFDLLIPILAYMYGTRRE